MCRFDSGSGYNQLLKPRSCPRSAAFCISAVIPSPYLTLVQKFLTICARGDYIKCRGGGNRLLQLTCLGSRFEHIRLLIKARNKAVNEPSLSRGPTTKEVDDYTE